MNWQLLKRPNLNARPCPTNGLCTVTEETEIDYAFLRLQKLEETSRYLRKEVKQLTENALALSRSELKLTTDLSSCSLVTDDEQLRGLVEDYHSVAKQMIDSAKTFSETCDKTVNDPLKLYVSEFNSIQGAVKKRDQIVSDILPTKSKLSKFKERERTGANVVRMEQLRRSLSSMEDEFKASNKQLMNDMKTVLDLRTDYLEPSLVALTRAQIDHYGECTRLFTSLVQTGNSPRANSSSCGGKARVEPPASELAAAFQRDMKTIKSLSIVH